MRVVTLVPGATEIVGALGLEPVGVSHACPSPAAATSPTITRSRVDSTADSAGIDAQVHASMADHGGVYEIDRETLARVDPDLIITQDVCDVCAVDRILVEDALADMDLNAAVLPTDVHSLEDLLADIERIGAATGTESRAARLVGTARERIARVERIAEARATTPRVLVLDWMDPVMVAGHWIPELVELAGGAYGIADPGADSRPVVWERIAAFDPEVLVVAPCGFPLAQTLDHSHELTDRSEWSSLSAVRTDRVFAMDGDRFVNRPGPRLLETMEYLAGLIQPALFEEPPTDVSQPLTPRSQLP